MIDIEYEELGIFSPGGVIPYYKIKFKYKGKTRIIKIAIRVWEYMREEVLQNVKNMWNY